MVQFLRLVAGLAGSLLLVTSAALWLQTDQDGTPPSAWIVFVSEQNGSADVMRMRPDGTVQQRVTAGPGSDSNPQWSPDGQWIAFLSYHPDALTTDIYRVRLNGTGEERLTTNAAVLRTPSWSPDGQWIAFEAAGDNRDNYEVCRMRANGTDKRCLTSSPGWDGMPSWSPDGQRIAFLSEREGSAALYRMRANGTDQQRLSDPALPLARDFPQWSPDGQHLTFVSSPDEFNNQMNIYETDGSSQQPITSGHGWHIGPKWSPDGQWILFEYCLDPNGEAQLYALYRMRIDGTGLKRLTTTDVWGAQWSPDGQWIAFTSRRHGNYEVYRMRADGSDQQRLTVRPGPDYDPQWSPPLRRQWRPWRLALAGFLLAGTALLSPRYSVWVRGHPRNQNSHPPTITG